MPASWLIPAGRFIPSNGSLHSKERTMVTPRRNISAVITLFFVAPLVAEYLLGDLPLKLLTALIVLAPAYGGAAVLIRETARRAGRGWPTMLMLGAAYTVIAEGLVTQSLFNPDYLKMHMHLLDPAYIPMLGIGAWWTLFMFNLHTFWSMGVSIALVEALFPADAESPWLGRVGDSIVALVFVLGSAASFAIGFKQNQFVASHAQLLSAAALSVLLMVSAFLIPAATSRVGHGRVPSPWNTSPWISCRCHRVRAGHGRDVYAAEVGLGSGGCVAGNRRGLSRTGRVDFATSGMEPAAYPEPGSRRRNGLRHSRVFREAVGRRVAGNAHQQRSLFRCRFVAYRFGHEARNPPPDAGRPRFHLKIWVPGAPYPDFGTCESIKIKLSAKNRFNGLALQAALSIPI
jgi:hypothetical protein